MMDIKIKKQKKKAHLNNKNSENIKPNDLLNIAYFFMKMKRKIKNFIHSIVIMKINKSLDAKIEIAQVLPNMMLKVVK